MDEESLRECLVLASDNPVYALAVRAADLQSAFTVDRLSWKLKAALPVLDYEPFEPPEALYNGTVQASVEEILRHGIKPMGR
jgi:hypothetical protein